MTVCNGITTYQLILSRKALKNVFFLTLVCVCSSNTFLFLNPTFIIIRIGFVFFYLLFFMDKKLFGLVFFFGWVSERGR